MDAINEQAFLVLTALADEPRHGYGLIGEVERLSDGRVKPATATLYALLDRLTRDGLVEVDREETENGRLRRYFRLTEQGLTTLATEAKRRASVVDVARTRLASRGLALGRDPVNPVNEEASASAAAPPAGVIERRCRRLIRLLPADYRADHGEALYGTLLDVSGDRARPPLREQRALALLALRLRLLGSLDPAVGRYLLALGLLAVAATELAPALFYGLWADSMHEVVEWPFPSRLLTAWFVIPGLIWSGTLLAWLRGRSRLATVLASVACGFAMVQQLGLELMFVRAFDDEFLLVRLENMLTFPILAGLVLVLALRAAGTSPAKPFPHQARWYAALGLAVAVLVTRDFLAEKYQIRAAEWHDLTLWKAALPLAAVTAAAGWALRRRAPQAALTVAAGGWLLAATAAVGAARNVAYTPILSIPHPADFGPYLPAIIAGTLVGGTLLPAAARRLETRAAE